jgi:hypothetical protein
MHLDHEIEPLPCIDSGLDETLMSVRETADLLGLSLAEVADLACRERSPLPATQDGRGGIGFYRSDVECWQIDKQ